jgi:hypothetical protein
MLLPNGDEVEAIVPLAPSNSGLFWELLPKCCHPTHPMQGTGPSRKLSNIPSLRPMMVLQILVGTSGDVTAGTQLPERADTLPRLFA